MEKSLIFYRDLLGLIVERNMNESGNHIDKMLSMKDVKVNTVKMSAKDKGPTMIELLEFKSHPCESNYSNISKIGSSHVAFTVDDLDKTYEKFIAADVKFNAPPTVVLLLSVNAQSSMVKLVWMLFLQASSMAPPDLASLDKKTLFLT